LIKKKLKKKKFKGRRLGCKRRRKLDETFILRRKRESELERKSDNNNQIPVPANTTILIASIVKAEDLLMEDIAVGYRPFPIIPQLLQTCQLSHIV